MGAFSFCLLNKARIEDLNSEKDRVWESVRAWEKHRVWQHQRTSKARPRAEHQQSTTTTTSKAQAGTENRQQHSRALEHQSTSISNAGDGVEEAWKILLQETLTLIVRMWTNLILIHYSQLDAKYKLDTWYQVGLHLGINSIPSIELRPVEALTR